jgi:hypothetical protein
MRTRCQAGHRLSRLWICGTVLFCDNYIVGGGTPVGSRYFANGQLATDFVTLTGIAPGQPFNITEVSHLVSDPHLGER